MWKGRRERGRRRWRRGCLGGKKYYWGGGGADRCQGESHFTFSLTCLLAEAQFLGRTLVLATLLCINAAHNNGTLLQRPTGSLLQPLTALQ